MQRKRGFTLIELLVVIAIIGILATLVVTQLGTAQQRAKNTSAQSDITQGGKGIEIFKSNDTNSSNKVIASSSAVGGTTLNAAVSTNGFTTLFSGVLLVDTVGATSTYGTRLSKTPGTGTYIYTYKTPVPTATALLDNPTNVPAGSYVLSTLLNSTVSAGAPGAFWVINGASASGAAGSIPTCTDATSTSCQ